MASGQRIERQAQRLQRQQRRFILMLSFSFRRLALLWTVRRVPTNGERPRVLAVDGNPDGAFTIAAYLSLEDIDSRAAFGGRQATEAARVWTPHVILMDVSMPECDGIEAARVLRRDSRTAGIAIIAFTAFDEVEVRRQLRDSEFDGYLQKGVALTEMLKLVKAFIQ